MMLTVAVSLTHSLTPSRPRIREADAGLNLSRTLSSYSRVISSLTVKSRTSVEGSSMLIMTDIGVSSSKSELTTEGKIGLHTRYNVRCYLPAVPAASAVMVPLTTSVSNGVVPTTLSENSVSNRASSSTSKTD